MMKNIDVGDGAAMPLPGDDLEWQLRYNDPYPVRYQAAAVVAAYNYLIGCSQKEALRRLKILRKALVT